MPENGNQRSEPTLQELGFYTPRPPRAYAWFVWLNIIAPSVLKLTGMILNWIGFPYWMLWNTTILTAMITFNLLNLWLFATVRSQWSWLFLIVAILNVVWSLFLGGTSFLLYIYNVRYAASVVDMLKQNGVF